MPTTEAGKAIASRNATTHGLFARDVVLPALGEDPEGYKQLEAQWLTQLTPANLLERHYVEKIAAASWRLRRLHRWQAQLFEDETLTEDDRLDRLTKMLRHETALQRQIDTAVKMLSKEVSQLYERRVRAQVLEEAQLSERECRDNPRDEIEVDLETRGRLRRIRKATTEALETLSQAPLDTQGAAAAPASGDPPLAAITNIEICKNELPLTLGWPASLPRHAPPSAAHPVASFYYKGVWSDSVLPPDACVPNEHPTLHPSL